MAIVTDSAYVHGASVQVHRESPTSLSDLHIQEDYFSTIIRRFIAFSSHGNWERRGLQEEME